MGVPGRPVREVPDSDLIEQLVIAAPATLAPLS